MKLDDLITQVKSLAEMPEAEYAAKVDALIQSERAKQAAIAAEMKKMGVDIRNAVVKSLVKAEAE